MSLCAKLIGATLTLLLLAACDAQIPPVQRATLIDDVEFAAILANPTKFDHVKIRIKGVARIEFEGNSLYADRSAYDARTSKDALWLEIGWPVTQDVQQLNGHDVIVEGTFDASLRGHERAYAGSMVGVDKLSPAR